MFKIQNTNIREINNKETQIDLEISDDADLGNASMFVVASVKISRPDSAYRFESMQARALRQVSDLVDQVAGELEKKIANSR